MQGTDDGAMDYGLNRALDAYYNDRKWFHGLQKRVMEQVRAGGAALSSRLGPLAWSPCWARGAACQLFLAGEP